MNSCMSVSLPANHLIAMLAATSSITEVPKEYVCTAWMNQTLNLKSKLKNLDMLSDQPALQPHLINE